MEEGGLRSGLVGSWSHNYHGGLHMYMHNMCMCMWDDHMGELRDLACVVSWRVACGTSVCVAPGDWRT